mgnify:CR=1 FL=1
MRILIGELVNILVEIVTFTKANFMLLGVTLNNVLGVGNKYFPVIANMRVMKMKQFTLITLFWLINLSGQSKP